VIDFLCYIYFSLSMLKEEVEGRLHVTNAHSASRCLINTNSVEVEPSRKLAGQMDGFATLIGT
jgi:hypothetical protein